MPMTMAARTHERVVKSSPNSVTIPVYQGSLILSAKVTIPNKENAMFVALFSLFNEPFVDSTKKAMKTPSNAPTKQHPTVTMLSVRPSSLVKGYMYSEKGRYKVVSRNMLPKACPAHAKKYPATKNISIRRTYPSLLLNSVIREPKSKK